jgi:hypothetical protein
MAVPSRRNSGFETTSKLRVDAVAVQHAADPVVGVDRDRALFHDDFVTVNVAGNL